MKLEEQVVSLELAKKLKELGVKQESYWYHATSFTGEMRLYHDTEHKDDNRAISAFSVAELGQMLPEYTDGYKSVRTYWDKSKGVGAEISLPEKYYQDDQNSRHATTHYAATEADARAKMLIYLIENKLYEPTQTQPSE
jgi:hypothetical protein